MDKTSYTIKELEAKLEKSRRWLLLDFPLLAGEALRMPHILDPRVPTACTNGQVVRWNPQFLAALDDEGLLFTGAHEIGHPILFHSERMRPEWNKELANIAADEEVNHLLSDCASSLGRIKVPDNAYCSSRFKGMAFEEIYEVLTREAETSDSRPDNPEGGGESDEEGEPGDEGGAEAPEDGGGESNAPPEFSPDDVIDISDYTLPPVSTWGEVEPSAASDGREFTKEEKARIEKSRSIDFEADTASAELRGQLPDGMADRIRGILERGKVDWVKELNDFISDAATDDSHSTWKRPNRRFASAGIIMPSLEKEGMGELAVLIDSSSSMNNELFKMATSETASLINFHDVKKTWVIEFTSHIKSVREFEDDVEFTEENAGRRYGGGTNPSSSFDWVKAKGDDITGIIVISDMELSPPEDPNIPVLWVNVKPGSRRYFDTPDYGREIMVRASS